MPIRTAGKRVPSRLEYLLGWMLALVCLVAFFFSPNVRLTNGDSYGWASYLAEYGRAEGTILYPTVPKESGSRPSRLSEEQLRELGERERSAGWWVLWNPHHLLYLPVTATIYRVVRQVWPILPALRFLRWWNLLASVGTILLLYRLMIRIVPGSPYPLAWCVFLAFSPTFFRYATDGAQYPTPIFFLSVACCGLWAFAEQGKPSQPVRSAFWLAFAVLFHQLASIVVPFILVGTALLVGEMRKNGREIPWKRFWWPAGIAVGLPIAVYLVVAAFALGPTGEFTVSGIAKYVTLYGRQGAYWTSSLWGGIERNLLSFVGFYFGNARMRDLFLSHVPFTLFVMVVPAMWFTALFNWKKLFPSAQWWLGMCLLWILPLLVFLSVWNPGHDFYHLFLTIPLGSVAVLGAESARSKGKRGWIDVGFFWLWCAAAIWVNFSETFAGCRWYGD